MRGAVDPEVDRVRSVYAGYERDPRKRATWGGGNLANDAMWREFQREADAALRRAGVAIAAARILDVGCGRGRILEWLRDLGAPPAHLHGVDLLRERVAEANAAHADARYLCADGRHLPFSDRAFDVVFCVNLFGSILSRGVAAAVASEMQRVLKPGGAIVWCDSRYPNPWNRHVRGYSRRAIRRLFPHCRLDLRTITVAPPLVRPLGRRAAEIYRLLARLPFLRVRYLGIIRAAGPVQGKATR